jgi:hypothetical protein
VVPVDHESTSGVEDGLHFIAVHGSARWIWGD